MDSHVGNASYPVLAPIRVRELFSPGRSQRVITVETTLPDMATEGPIVGELVLNADVTGFKVSGALDATLVLTCDRCLQTYEDPVSLDVEEQFVFDTYLNPTAEKEKELHSEDFYDIIRVEGAFDPADLIRQLLMMERPGPNYCMAEDCQPLV